MYRESSFGISLLWKFVLIFQLQEFILAFRYFSLCTRSLSNTFLRLFLTISQISYFSNNLYLLSKKRHLVSSKSFLCAVIFGRNIYKGLIFSILVDNKIFKNLFLPKETLLETVILLISTFYLNRFFMLVKLLVLNFNITKFYNFFHFCLCFQKCIYFLYLYFFTFFLVIQKTEPPRQKKKSVLMF